MRTLLTICARGGSKGIPGKNIKALAGKPLIEYSFIIARRFKERFQEVDIAISTDAVQIAQVARNAGFEVPYTRPEALATDKAGKIGAIADVLHFYEKQNACRYDYILDLDVTSPLRSMKDLTEAFAIIQANNDAVNLFSVSPANRNPYFNMVERGSDGFYHLIKKLESDVLSRQSAPKVYDLNASFYFYKRLFFENGCQSALTDRSLIYEVPHFCFDLDHPVDFEFLSFLVEKNKLDFEWL